MLTGLLIFLAVGALAGWLAGMVMKGRGFGVIGNIIVGILGSIIGGALFDVLGITSGGIVAYVGAATVGAVALLAIIALVKKG